MSLTLDSKMYFIQNVVCERPLSCISTGAAGTKTRRSLGHHLLHPQILRPRALFCKKKDCTRSSKFLTHALGPIKPMEFIYAKNRIFFFVFYSYNG